jgi:NAD-dependent dihydropyrimidine dehydrogenase PreA subunit
VIAKINHNICDNSPQCGAISVCPVKAISWNAQEGLHIDSTKCIGCGLCVAECPVGAISVNNEEEIKKDPQKIAQLFVERYGAEAIDKKIIIKESEFHKLIKTINGLLVAEFFNDDSIQCLVKSIPISELFKNFKFYKVEAKTESENLPMMMIYKDGALLGKISGIYDVSKKEELINKIKKILNE